MDNRQGWTSEALAAHRSQPISADTTHRLHMGNMTEWARAWGANDSCKMHLQTSLQLLFTNWRKVNSSSSSGSGSGA
ncbi:hypothetical protein HYQ46_009556 [Verticillium longisporum]|nr:hypothetical protein HYQ46_009556 [Verticillium longisporum]